MKLEVLKLYNAQVPCYVCKELFLVASVQYDHVWALCHEGEHLTENLAPVCVECHKDKSRRDVRDLHHVRRLTSAQSMHAAIIAGDMIRAKSKIPSRPFQKRVKT